MLQIPCIFVARGGKAGEVICEVAEQKSADLIVVGTRGKGKLRRTIIGSVSSYVTQHAPCPVLVSRPKGMRDPHHVSTSTINSVDAALERITQPDQRQRRNSGETSQPSSGRRQRYHSESEVDNTADETSKSRLNFLFSRFRYVSQDDDKDNHKSSNETTE